jgi:hypothetical protein
MGVSASGNIQTKQNTGGAHKRGFLTLRLIEETMGQFAIVVSPT